MKEDGKTLDRPETMADAKKPVYILSSDIFPVPEMVLSCNIVITHKRLIFINIFWLINKKTK